MRLLLITTLALSQAIVVLSQYAEAAFQVPTYSSTCEEQARQSGLPTDGWEIVYGDGGQPKCRRVAVQELGICRGVEYIDADTKDKKCCQDVSGLTWIDRPAKLAKCCAKDHAWSFDNGDSPTRGGCCMIGLHMHNGRCIPSYTPPPPLHCPPGTYLINDRCAPIIAPLPRCPPGTFLQDGMCIPIPVPIVSCPVGTYLINDQCVPVIPRHCPPATFMRDGMCIPVPSGVCPIGTRMQDGQCVPLPQTCANGYGGVESSCACTNYPVCGHGKYLGIKYGHCYILSFSDGQQFSAVREKTMYVKGGFFDDIPFKVCKSTNDCSHGKEVEMDESFYLHHQHGLYTDLTSTRGWIDNAHNGDHLGLTLDANMAGRFTGTPTYAGNECGIELRGGPVNGGMGYACPMAMPGWGNPRVSKNLRFSEVTCNNYEVPFTSAIYPARG
ncbi:hypothetical protein EV702DRAFT_1128195 [Suillus placidus]|uniref:Uncharacterized protein n=1 Tax=Suillus placidus TaxID=48579 RepID=A0A9P6ZP12_9AGAM|nr:hypothetical protein EV702DRAFT_1128195 [Suillus placidus]